MAAKNAAIVTCPWECLTACASSLLLQKMENPTQLRILIGQRLHTTIHSK
jgi:hypothetical protein